MRSEITHLQSQDTQEKIVWVDIGAQLEAITNHEELARFFDRSKRLYAIDRKNRKIFGADALVAIWELLPGRWWWLAIGMHMPIIREPLFWLYHRSALKRFKQHA